MNKNIIDFIKKHLIDKAGRIHSSKKEKWFKINKYDHELKTIISCTDFLPKDATLNIRIHFILNNLNEIPKCQTCKKSLWYSLVKRFVLRRFCNDPKCAQKNEEVQQKIKKTNKEKYGVEHHLLISKEKYLKRKKVTNISQLPEVQQKKKENALKKYGVLSQQRHLGPDAMKKLNDISYLKEHDRAFIMKDTGVSQSHLSKLLLRTGISDGIKSKIEKEIYDFIKEHYDGSILQNKRTIVPGYELDLYLPDEKFAIEYHGLFWHSEQKKGKKYHYNKNAKIKKHGIDLYEILENEWYEKSEIWKSMILNRLNKSKKIFGRKCMIKTLTQDEEKMFFNKTHLQSYCPSTLCIGLVYDNEIQCAMSFKKPRFNKKYNWEILRFSNNLNHTVIGGASKLFTHFIKMYPNESIISYANCRYSSGNLYSQIGMAYEGQTPPNYFYIIDWKTLSNRVNFQKHKLKDKFENFDPSLTEYENCLNNGYDRFWDSGNLIFVLE